jgi:4-hydroxybenzoate polyprenyltransferase
VVKKYLSLVKFSHTIFALPFALIGFFLGVMSLDNFNTPLKKISDYMSSHWHVFVLVLLCMVFARSAAMAYNRYLDRHFDAKNPRTAIREIPAGVISARSALWFAVLMSVLFVACTWFINLLCFFLSPVALAVILGYSYTKRFTPLCHLILGLGLSLAPIGAYLAVTGVFSLLPIFFSFAVIFWVSGFDIIYALQDEEFDQQHELYSIPAWLGKKKALRVSEILHILSATAVAGAGLYGNFGFWYWIGFAVFTGMLHDSQRHRQRGVCAVYDSGSGDEMR